MTTIMQFDDEEVYTMICAMLYLGRRGISRRDHKTLDAIERLGDKFLEVLNQIERRERGYGGRRR